MAEMLAWTAVAPFTIRICTGARYVLGEDPLDSRIIVETYGKNSPLYFPVEADGVVGDGIVLDVGAHHGVYSIAAALRYPQCRVVAVEPDSTGIVMLQRNIVANGLTDRIEVSPVAISDKAGSGRLVADSEGSWGNRLALPDERVPATTIRTATLKDVLKGRCPRVVKANCEGGEFVLVPQLFDLGITPPILIILVHASAGDVALLNRLIVSKGYSIREFSKDPMKPRWLCVLK